jgi:hypothetical protein
VSARPLDVRIALVEKRLELHRERTARHWHETRAGVERAARWLPLLAVVGALAAGVAAGKRPRATHATAMHKPGFFAAIAAAGATLVRIAMSPQARALWSAWRGRHGAPVH